jgi:MIP family channel proteins
MRREWLGEAAGTFLLVFLGTGAVMASAAHPVEVPHGWVSLAFGLAVFACIEAFGPVSGAHLNPAVTVGLALAHRVAWRTVPGYVASQLLGAVMASGLLRWLLGPIGRMGATMPSGPAWQSFAIELAFTFVLFLVVLRVTGDDRGSGSPPALTIGAVIALEALVGGPVSGASMNPARSFGPAVVSGLWSFHWIYWVAPLLGAALAVPVARWMARPAGNG